MAQDIEAPGGSSPDERRSAPGAEPAPGDLSDAEIVHACLEGRTELFAELVRRYTKVVATYLFSRLGSRDLAEELTQEAMVRAFEFLPRLKAPRNFSAWLLGIAHNTMTRVLEDRKRSVPLEEAVLVSGNPSGATGLERLSRDELRRRVLTEVARLPSRYRIPLMMKYQSDYSCEKIAEYLGLPVGTVTSRLSRAYELLYESLAPAVVGRPKAKEGPEPEEKGT